MDNSDRSFTQEEAAKYLGVELRTMENWRSDKKGPIFYKPTNRLVYYFKSDLDAWVKGGAK